MQKPTRPRPPPRKPKNVAPPSYGGTLPDSFFERLRLFELESSKRKQELCEKINQEIQEHLLKGMEGQHRVAPEGEDAILSAMKGKNHYII